MKEKNYSYLAFIKKTIPLFLMMLFVNLGWGQVTIVDKLFLPSKNVPSGSTGWTITALANNAGTDYWKMLSGTNSMTSPVMNFSSYTDITVTLSLQSFGTITNNSDKIKVEYFDGTTWTQVGGLLTTGAKADQTVSLLSGSISSSAKIRITAPNATATVGARVYSVEIKGIVANLAPTVSNVQITGLPNTTVELTGTYDYADTENDVDASTYKWYTATDGFGANATVIGGETTVNYTLTTNELGKYIRFGVTAAAATGTSPGAEAFSFWIGPVNAAGTPVLNAGLLADFNATCINTTSDASSFTLMGNNLTGDVTVGALSGFAFSATENGTYTSTLTISPVSEGIDVVVYVKFTSTVVQSYNGNITISGGGAASVDVSVVASGINTPVSVTTGVSDALTSNSATLNGSLVQGCSAIVYGIEYSTTINFDSGTGTPVESSNLNAGNFTVDLSGLESATTYYYKAFATDDNGTVRGNQDSFTTKSIESPTATAATAVTQTGFTANWGAVSGATGYELDVYEKLLGLSPNLVQNPGFENVDLSAWTFELAMNEAISTTEFKSGNSSLYTTVTATKNFSQEIFVENTTEYVLKFSYFIDGTSTGNGFRVWTTTGSDIKLPTASTYYNVKGSWQTVEHTFTTSGTNLALNFRLYNGVKIYFDDVEVVKSQSSLVPTYVNGYNDLPVSGLSKVVTGLTPNTEYFYVVRAKDANSTSISSNEKSVKTKPTSVTWNGTAWSNTSGPDETIDAVIDGNFTTSGNLTAKSLTINSDKVFTVATLNTLTVENAITNNAGVTGLVIESDAVLLQTSTAANTTASATVKRNSNSLFRQDYTLWSSPVYEPNLRNFSPNTVFNRFYSYDYTSGIAGAYKQEIVTGADVTNKTFGLAKGYLIRMPNITSPVVDGYENYTTELVFNGEFKGNLNNGTITTPLYGDNATSNGYTLVGNPYPSPINISNFLTDNSQIIGSLYFWRKKNSFLSPSGSGYVTYNIGTQSLVGVGNNVGINGGTLTHINTGQGFLVKTDLATPTDLVFNNTMRENTSTIFFKSTPDATPELNRFWLDLSLETNLVGQTLVAYATDATEGVDGNFDSLYINDSPLALTSIINNDEYIIQGKSLPFLTSDVVSLGFKTDIAGSFTIALSNFDGLFAENQAIYLKDKLNNTLHNLKIEAYTFTSPVGVFNDRFEVKYEGALGTNNPVALENNILIAVKNQQIKINAGTVTMDKVELIDVAGRIIYTLDGVNATTVTVENVPATNQILIVKISTKENGVVTQKIIF